MAATSLPDAELPSLLSLLLELSLLSDASELSELSLLSVAAILPLLAATSLPDAELASLLSEESVLLSVVAVEFSFAAADESPVLSALAVAV